MIKKNFTISLAVAAVVGLGLAAGCDRDSNKQGQNPGNNSGQTDRFGTPKVPEKAEWTPQEIAADPQGYIKWSERKIDRQVAEHEAKLRALAAKKQQFQEKHNTLNQNIEDVENLRIQAERAYKRADDNDRWPAIVGGREFERDRLEKLIPELKKYAEDRRPMQRSYSEFMDKIARTENMLQQQIVSARNLKEQLAIDAQSIELNQSAADLGKLTASQTQLASMSQTLKNMSDDPTNAQPPGEPPGRVKIDDLLK